MSEIEVFNPRSVTIRRTRWQVYVTVLAHDWTKHEYVASADAGYTYGDGIYFGTAEEFEDDSKELF